MDFTALFVDVDDSWKRFRPEYESRLIADGTRRRRREGKLSVSEIMTLLIAFQISNYRTFKHFYLHVQRHHRDAFPDLVHYGRFVKLTERVTLPLFAYLRSRCMGEVTGIGFIDATPLRVCSTKRVSRHRTFDGLAALGKSTVGWFFGFKLHLVINDRGELLAFAITPGNVDPPKADQPVPTLAKSLWGRLFGDKGYLDKALFDELYKGGVKLVTQIRKNMKNKLMGLEEKLLLRKRSLIETVNDQLKNVCQIEHARHRKPSHFLVHLLAGLAASANQPTKPSLNLNPAEQDALAALP